MTHSLRASLIRAFLIRAAVGAFLLLPALFFAPAQSHPSSGHETHHYDLADPALASAAQRYDWAQEGKGNRTELEKLVAEDYVLFRASGKIANKAGLISMLCWQLAFTQVTLPDTP